MKERGIGFEEIIAAIANGQVVRLYPHHSHDRHPEQWIYEVEIKGYIYLVPFEKQGRERMLKTIYPSRKATKEYNRKTKS